MILPTLKLYLQRFVFQISLAPPIKAKLLLCLVFIVGLSHVSSAQAQRNDELARSGRTGSISFSPRIGTTFSTHHTPEGDGDGVDLRYKTGLQVGAVLNFGITDVFSVQPEILYIQKGATVHLNMNEMPTIVLKGRQN